VTRRLCPILAAGLAIGLAGCGHEGPADPAVAVPGEGIPMGAASAVGVSFDAPAAAPAAPPGKAKPPPHADPDDDDEVPPDPFADPLALPPGSATGPHKGPPPHHHPKSGGGMAL
jgi:hypothetical protein